MVKINLLAFFGFFLPIHLYAGWVIQQQVVSKAGTEKEIYSFQNGLLKKEGKSLTVLMDLKSQKISFIQPTRKLYYSGNLQEIKAEIIKMTRQKYAEMITKASEEKKKAYEVARDEKLEDFENPVRNLKIEIKPIRGYLTLLGCKADQYQVFVNNKLKCEVWLSSKFLTDKSFDLESFCKLTSSMYKYTRLAYRSSKEWIALIKKGYILKSIEYGSLGNSETLVISKTDKNLSENDFAIPTGFKKTSFSDIYNDDIGI